MYKTSYSETAYVSIIMPAYNAEKTISASIESVKRQTIHSWELIVIDDCSTDCTLEIIRESSLHDSRVRILSTEKNSGSPALPRNIGVKEAKYRYIAFLDADDLWEPEKLARQLNFMQDMKIALSCTSYTVIDKNSSTIGSLSPPKAATYYNLLNENTIGCSTAMYDMSILGKRYFPICGHEDYALWLIILREGHIAYGINESLSIYRLQQNSVSSNKIKVLSFFWRIYRKQEKFSFIKSTLLCFNYAWNAKRKYHRT
jgi:teichuronic acid biosynthesis glycosyltransferase TuaG